LTQITYWLSQKNFRVQQKRYCERNIPLSDINLTIKSNYHCQPIKRKRIFIHTHMEKNNSTIDS